jgi:hypothetical protein
LTGKESIEDVCSILIALENRADRIEPYDAVVVQYPILSSRLGSYSDPCFVSLEDIHLEMVYKLGWFNDDGLVLNTLA